MARAVAESVVLRERSARRGRRRKLGGRDRPGRSSGAQRHAPSIRRIRSSGAWCSKASAAARKPADWTAASLAQFAPEFTPDMARLLDPREGMKTREIAGGTGPEAVAAALIAARAAPGQSRMTKSFRHGQILKLIRARSISTQEELARALKELGHRRHAGHPLPRYARTGAGEDRRRLPGDRQRATRPAFAALASEFLQDVRQAQNQVVLKTAPGHASSVAVALDDDEWPEVVGTIAGDDTILVICPDSKHGRSGPHEADRAFVSSRITLRHCLCLFHAFISNVRDECHRRPSSNVPLP